ncbi:DUF4292 domain-containing protein [Hymenobacter sp. DG25A]|uniref:DUF4292 domain-containing protein n=1 Tax=Hymenobacter sp. DG25A TaxID=1385663 RepID=UPI0009EB0B7E|nr:DUF4292 domain-containing protein [Hymenobacter sp. DG25A]
MNRRFAPLVLALVLIMLGACTRKAIPTRPAATEVPKVVDLVRADNLDFKFLSAKGKAQIETNGEKMPNANLSLRMRKDSIIWLSVSVVGVEVLRAHLTPDSVQILDKLHREYYAGNFDYLRQRFNLPVTFQQIQALVVGNYVPSSDENTPPTVSTEGPLQKVQYQQASLFVEQLIEQTRQRVQKLAVKDQNSKTNFTVDYSDFKPLLPQPQQFANALLVMIQPPNGPASTASINFRNIDVDKERLSFPFSVPSDYVRKK